MENMKMGLNMVVSRTIVKMVNYWKGRIIKKIKN